MWLMSIGIHFLFYFHRIDEKAMTMQLDISLHIIMLEYCCHDLFLILILVMICFCILYTPADKAKAWCGTAVIP